MSACLLVAADICHLIWDVLPACTVLCIRHSYVSNKVFIKKLAKKFASVVENLYLCIAFEKKA